MVTVLNHLCYCQTRVNVWTNVQVHTNCRKTWNFICFHMDAIFRLESICIAVFGFVDDDNNNDGTDWNVFKLLAGMCVCVCAEIFYHISEWGPHSKLTALHTHTNSLHVAKQEWQMNHEKFIRNRCVPPKILIYKVTRSHIQRVLCVWNNSSIVNGWIWDVKTCVWWLPILLFTFNGISLHFFCLCGWTRVCVRARTFKNETQR